MWCVNSCVAAIPMQTLFGDVARVMQGSAGEALHHAISRIWEGLRESKLDTASEMQVDADGVVLLRIDRHARATEVTNALLEAPGLASCCKAEEDAGCRLQPPWDHGAWLLVPVMEVLYLEPTRDCFCL